MELQNLKVAVIGAGIGGLAVARGLALRGADVTVLEQADAIREVGAGLQISPNGFVVLQALGLGETLKTQSVRAKSVSLRDFQGDEVLNLDLGLLENQDYHFVHRADLIDVLAAGARDSGVKIRLLQSVERVETGTVPRIHLANGATVEADLVIGADGLHSVARKALNGTSAPFFTRQVAWRAVIPNTVGRGPEVHVHMAPHRHLVSYPLRGGRLLNIVAVQERTKWADESWSQKDDPLAVQVMFEDFCDDVQAMLSQIEDVHLWGLFRHPVAANWFGDGLAILGDAAHPTLPFMAQGACLALEDAWVLADSLSKAPTMTSALKTYQSQRIDRARKVVDAANANAWKYHVAFPPLRWALHSGLRVAGALAPARMMRQFDWIYGHDVVDHSRHCAPTL